MIPEREKEREETYVDTTACKPEDKGHAIYD